MRFKYKLLYIHYIGIIKVRTQAWLNILNTTNYRQQRRLTFMRREKTMLEACEKISKTFTLHIYSDLDIIVLNVI